MEIKLTDANFTQEVLEAKLPCLVDFWAEWCGPCRMVAPTVKEIATEYKGKLKVCKLNIDEAPRTASRYKVMSIPTLTLFKDGAVVDQIIGAVPKKELVAILKRFIG